MSDPVQSDRRASLEALIRENNFGCVFQPIVDLRWGSNIAFEALTTLPPGSSFQNITEVLDVADQEGLMWELEYSIRRSALRAVVDWPNDVLLFLNSTPTVVTDDRFEDAILSEVDQTPGFTPQRIILEVTERSETHSESVLMQRLLRLKTMGFRIAIDDVGAGSNGLNRIMALRPHWLKLDRELIGNIDADPFKQNLVDFFVNFSKHSGVGLIVEGVERKQELRTLIDLGVEAGQGYYLRKPDAHLGGVGPEVASLIVQRAALANGRKRLATQYSIVEQFAHDALCCDSDQTVASVAELVGDIRLTPGVVVMNGAQLIGWVTRQAILTNAQDPITAKQPIKKLALTVPAPIDAATPLTEALTQLACRKDIRDASPIIVSHDGSVQGVMPVEDLLIATARMATETNVGAHPITGMPIRSQCDRVFLEAVNSNITINAVFIDIPKFHIFNEEIGYDAGDLALRILSGILITSTPADGECEIVGHLGDDRFLILQNESTPRIELEEIVTEFEHAMERFAVHVASHTETQCSLRDRPPSLGLCIVQVDAASVRASLPSELSRLIHQTKSSTSGSRIGARSTLINLTAPSSLIKSA